MPIEQILILASLATTLACCVGAQLWFAGIRCSSRADTPPCGGQGRPHSQHRYAGGAGGVGRGAGLMNNMGALALLVPVAIQLAARLGLPSGNVLKSSAFALILGSIIKLIGTPLNLIASGLSEGPDSVDAFTLFDSTAVGLHTTLLGYK